MPPKDTQPRQVYFIGSDGKCGPLRMVTEIEFPEETSQKPYMHMPFSNEPMEFEIELDKPISRRMMIFLLTGKWYSNNWLRMHGLPMERKGYRGKRK